MSNFRPKNILKNQGGQSFFEFVLLMLVIFGLSFSILRGFNIGVSEIWKSYISIIAHPTESVIEFQ